MLASYLKIAFRTLKNRLGVTAINVLGLAVGLAACLLIGLWVRHQLSYDRFHPGAAQTYRITFDGERQNQTMRAPLSPAPMGPMLVDRFPEVKQATRLGTTESATVQVGDRTFRETQLLAADSTFFDVFGGFTLRRGDPATALTDAEAVVLTAPTAERYFGTTDVLGQTLQIGETTRRVTGVLAPVPSNSHLQFSLITAQNLPREVATQWSGNNFYTYLRLGEGASAEAFGAKMDRFVRSEVVPQIEEALGVPLSDLLGQGVTYQYDLQALTDIHLHADSNYEITPTGSIETVYVFMAVALLTLLIACVNFMNLATARATERGTEVGIRKAVGAGRSQLAGQFLGEAVLTTAAAFVLALGLASLAQPLFTQLSGVPLSAGDLLGGPMLLILGASVVVVGLVAGSYPALVLSRFEPAQVLKESPTHGTGGGNTWIRRGLVVTQFVISIALIAGTLIVREQYDYIQSKRLGFEQERVVALDRGEALGGRQDAFLERIRQQSGVVTASMGDRLFGFVTQTGYTPAGSSSKEPAPMNVIDVGARFVETLDLDLVAGRTFEPGRPADSSAVLLNEAAVEALGWTPSDAVGRQLQEMRTAARTVVGVVENFHFRSLRERIQPLVLRFDDTQDQVFVRLAPGDPQPALDGLRTAWTQVAGAGPFQYTFLDQDFARLHRSTERAGRLLTLFAGLAIVIACLGLFGLATYTVQQRTREIGIRKALGATATQIVRLLSKDFLRLVGVAFVIAAPLAYYGTRRWLQDFAYRIDLGVGWFALAGGLALVIAFLTVSTQAWRAAQTDPTQALQQE
jgi:putative ABC transport system permease protein